MHHHPVLFIALLFVFLLHTVSIVCRMRYGNPIRHVPMIVWAASATGLVFLRV